MPASKAQRALTAERRAKLIRLRAVGTPFEDIAQELGYASRTAATKDFLRALEQNREEEAAEVATYRQLENERLDAELVRLETLEATVRSLLANSHIVVNNGRVILHPDTEQPMEDDAFTLQVVDRLVKIEDARRRNAERRAKLNGYDAPERTELTGAEGGPLAVSNADPDKVEALIAATSRLDSDAPANTATSTPDANDDEDEDPAG